MPDELLAPPDPDRHPLRERIAAHLATFNCDLQAGPDQGFLIVDIASGAVLGEVTDLDAFAQMNGIVP